LQIQYTAVFDSTSNQTFYACADIHYVEASDFTGTEYCFNATESSSSSSSSASASSSSAAGVSGKGTASGGSLSKGAIAGAVVGSVVVGAALLAGMAVWFCRKLQRAEKKARLAEMELRGRKVGLEMDGKMSQGSA
jgi:hypothetical protein